MTIEVKVDSKAPEQKVETPVVPPVETEEEVELSPVEQEAVSRGWRPKEEWDGDPDQWRSAKEFLDRGELLDKITSQSRELKQITAIVQQLSEQNRAVYRAGYERALSDLKFQKAKAMENDDHAAVIKIDDAIDTAKEALKKIDAAPQSQQSVTQETQAFSDFKARNAWYNSSTPMKHWAHGMALEYANANPQATEEAVYQFIEREVRKEFPHKFQRRQLPAGPDGESSRGTQGSRGTGGGKAAFEKVLAGMPEDQAKVARDMVRRGIVTAEKYVEDYNAVIAGR